MLAPGVMVYERRGRYAARLRRELAGQGLHMRVTEARSGKDCFAALRSRRLSAVVLEMMPNPLAGLELIGRIRDFDSSLLVTAVAERGEPWVEELAREFGATYCAFDAADVELLIDLIVRHLRQNVLETRPMEASGTRSRGHACTEA